MIFANSIFRALDCSSVRDLDSSDMTLDLCSETVFAVGSQWYLLGSVLRTAYWGIGVLGCTIVWRRWRSPIDEMRSLAVVRIV
jgi:hypothetical protein